MQYYVVEQNEKFKSNVDNISKKLWYVTSGFRGKPWVTMKDADKNMIILIMELGGFLKKFKMAKLFHF